MIGIVGGIVVAILANRINRPATKTRGIVTNTLGIIFGALGAQAADQLLHEGPQLFGSQIVPAIVGGIVLAFVVIYAGKKWFRLGSTN
ncbi:hypothetical protein QP862_03635 [Lacticaseibacillus rhamnosus]|nr:hypothetical protein [Lacticaseibacillus rhamnosus]MDK8384390.1 hypothetical protein [Lacticaseibacillus rhamnosus]MDK8750262.1 hypothetical protein [Lacticaseibacillus rhamnosus]